MKPFSCLSIAEVHVPQQGDNIRVQDLELDGDESKVNHLCRDPEAPICNHNGWHGIDNASGNNARVAFPFHRPQATEPYL